MKKTKKKKNKREESVFMDNLLILICHWYGEKKYLNKENIWKIKKKLRKIGWFESLNFKEKKISNSTPHFPRIHIIQLKENKIF